MVGWHHRLNGHEFEQTPGDGEGPGSLVCCGHWGGRIRQEVVTAQRQLRAWPPDTVRNTTQARKCHHRQDNPRSGGKDQLEPREAGHHGSRAGGQCRAGIQAGGGDAEATCMHMRKHKTQR